MKNCSCQTNNSIDTTSDNQSYVEYLCDCGKTKRRPLAAGNSFNIMNNDSHSSGACGCGGDACDCDD